MGVVGVGATAGVAVGSAGMVAPSAAAWATGEEPLSDPPAHPIRTDKRPNKAKPIKFFIPLLYRPKLLAPNQYQFGSVASGGS